MKITCSVCGTNFNLSLHEYSYINWKEPFVCSKNCVLSWIHSHKLPLLNYSSFAVKLYDLKEYKSEYEKNVAKFLTNHNIKFKYEFIGFNLFNETYTPDFYLPKYGCFLEVKGLWGIGSKKKMENFRVIHKNINLLILPWVISKEFIGNSLGVIK